MGRVRCCKDCVPPMRYVNLKTGCNCHMYCPLYLNEREALDEENKRIREDNIETRQYKTIDVFVQARRRMAQHNRNQRGVKAK